MLKKNKQLIIGFVLGALLFTIVPVNATVQEYILKKSPDKFIVDGEEIANEKLPMLKYGGYNYIPAGTFREICDKIGVGFEWIGEKKEIRIDTKRVSTQERRIYTMGSIAEDDKINETIDKFTATVNNEKYINTLGIRALNHRYDIRSDNMSTTKGLLIMYIDNGNGKIKPDEYNVLLEGVPIVTIDNPPTDKEYPSLTRYFIEYDYFEKHIFPLIND